MAQVTPVDLSKKPAYIPPAQIESVDLSSPQPVSQHRALAAAISGFKGNPDSANPHEAAVGKLQPVVNPQAPAASTPKNTTPAKPMPVHMGTGQ